MTAVRGVGAAAEALLAVDRAGLARRDGRCRDRTVAAAELAALTGATRAAVGARHARGRCSRVGLRTSEERSHRVAPLVAFWGASAGRVGAAGSTTAAPDAFCPQRWTVPCGRALLSLFNFIQDVRCRMLLLCRYYFTFCLEGVPSQGGGI